ncbi:MAG: single-stranded-DNA-specific exonuclease RecJ [Bacteroidales bacterium]|nr:single-stranded-DNA-specific exonuclease RecJ [Bacteroidales bacterium]
MDTQEVQWQLKAPADAEKASQLAAELGLDQVLANLLVQRGIETFDQARAFFRPQLEALHDPVLMKDMDKAVERLHKAITGGEKILVYGDYDVDGTTAVAQVYSFIRQFTQRVEFYIPDRYDEGYGLSYKALDWAGDNGVTLVITLDCGIKAIEKVEYARAKGIEVIICDHHLPEAELPKAVAILDPKREDCHYPFDDLCGCGVGFKLVQGYIQQYRLDPALLEPLLDLQVVSIASDLVSMTGENRILAHYGLKRLNEHPREGLLAMINLAKLEPGHIGIDDIVFKIGPRINAAGRMESGRLAVELLTATNATQAFKIGQQVNDNNQARKDIDRAITQEALEMVAGGTALASEHVTIVYNPTWNKGVVGIVASRLVEAYYKPTVVLTKSNGFITGSARSIQGFDLYASIESCADLLENFGGHMYAAGLTLREDKLEEFCRRMETFAAGYIRKEDTKPVIEIDAKLDFSQITPKFTRILKQFQPFGPGNSNPVFLTENVYDAGNGRKVGAGGVHLKLDVIQENLPYRQLAAIGFNMADAYYEHIKAGNPFDVCYSIVENFYRGSSTVQLRLKDIRKRDELI